MPNASPDYVLICPLDTITGIDLLSLANSHLGSKIKLLGCVSEKIGALNCNLNRLVELNDTLISELKNIRDKGVKGDPLSQIYKLFQRESVLTSDDLPAQVLIADIEGEHFFENLEHQKKHVIRLGEKSSSLEAFADFFSLQLEPEMLAHAIFSRDYISGLAENGISFNSSEQYQWNTSLTDILQKQRNLLVSNNDSSDSIKSVQLEKLRIGVAKENQLPTCLMDLFKQDCKDKGYQAHSIAMKSFPLRNTLMFYTCDGEDITSDSALCAVELVTTRAHYGAIKAVYDKFSQHHQLTLELQDRGSSCYMLAKINGNSNELKLDGRIENITKALQVKLDELKAQKVKFLTADKDKQSEQKKLEKLNQEVNELRLDLTKLKSNRFSKLMNYLIESILSIEMVLDRPLRHYGCTFFLPFTFEQSAPLTQLISSLPKTPHNYDELLPFINQYTPNDSESEAAKTKAAKQTNDTPNGDVQNVNTPEESAQHIIGETTKEQAQLNSEFGAYHYLHPAIREKLFSRSDTTKSTMIEKIVDSSEEAKPAIIEWRHNLEQIETASENDTTSQSELIWHMETEKQDGGVNTWSIPIERIKLHMFQGKMFLLSIHVFKNFQTTQDNSELWWRDLIDLVINKDSCSNQNALNQLDHPLFDGQINRWLTFTQAARELYRTFSPDNEEKGVSEPYRFSIQRRVPVQGKKEEIETKVEVKPCIRQYNEGQAPHFSADIRYFLTLFFNGQNSQVVDESFKLKPMTDNRMFVNVSYALAGTPTLTKGGEELHDTLFSLAAYVDTEKESWDFLNGAAYDPSFTKPLLESQRYDRWKMLGNCYGYNSYANVYLGHGDKFHTIIGPRNVFYPYESMLIMALLYRQALNYYSDLVDEASKDLASNELGAGTKFRELREQFMDFTNVYWFQELSSQVQGQDIFKLQIKGMELQKEFDFIDKEITVADQFIKANNSMLFTKVGGTVAFITILEKAVSHYIGTTVVDSKHMLTLGGFIVFTSFYCLAPEVFSLFIKRKSFKNPLSVFRKKQPRKWNILSLILIIAITFIPAYYFKQNANQISTQATQVSKPARQAEVPSVLQVKPLVTGTEKNSSDAASVKNNELQSDTNSQQKTKTEVKSSTKEVTPPLKNGQLKSKQPSSRSEKTTT